MVSKLFPYTLYLHIFQLDEYSGSKLLRWVFSHFFTRTTENKKLLVWTQKARAIYVLAITTAVVVAGILAVLFGLAGFIFGLLFATQAYFYLLLANILLMPYEQYRKSAIEKATERKILSFPNLKVIGITGSYGKTSVKEFLYQILKTKHSVLRTPESYNTPLGIAQVVELELDRSYEYFLCEMGAYRVGDIQEICDMVHPTHGILTGINEQHLASFGSLQNTTKTKFELINALPKNGMGVVNGDNDLVRGYLEKNSHGLRPNNKKIVPYGFADEKFSVRDIKQTLHGSEFTIILDGKNYSATTSLLGRSVLQNILGAATMSFLLGMKPQEIVHAIAHMQPTAHRLEVKEMETMTIIDDAYNSNVSGFMEGVALLTSFQRPTVLVTPGIVDLGDRTLSIHEDLGKLLDDVDHIILVGKSERTRGLKTGIKRKEKIIELSSVKQVWEKIGELCMDRPVVLLENDLPDNY